MKILGIFPLMFSAFTLCGMVACGDSSSAGNSVEVANHPGHTEFQSVEFRSCGGIPNDVLNSFGKNVDAPSKGLTRQVLACIEFEQVLTVADLKGSVKDSLGNPVGNISIYLPDQYLDAVKSFEKIVTDENGEFMLGNVPYKVLKKDYGESGDTSFYYSKKFQVLSEDGRLGALAEFDLGAVDTVRENGFVYLDIGTIVVEPLYSLQVSIEEVGLKKGDEYCLESIHPCHKVSSGDVSQGFFTMDGIPAGTYSYSYGNKKEGFAGGSAQVVTVGP